MIVFWITYFVAAGYIISSVFRLTSKDDSMFAILTALVATIFAMVPFLNLLVAVSFLSIHAEEIIDKR